MAVTSNVFQRTFNIRLGETEGTGTCFTIDVDERRYLVTAKHVIGGTEPEVVELKHDGKWKPVPVKLVGHASKEADISVLAPAYTFGGRGQLEIGEIHVGEDLYFLGYPFGLSTDGSKINYGLPLPLVKKAILSGMGENGLMYLDGHNNPGFSGGPVVSTNNKLVAVCTGYLAASGENDGIITAWRAMLESGVWAG